MSTRSQLSTLLDQLIAAPHDLGVRSGVDAALAEVNDDDLLAEMMRQFVAELPVAEAIERRLAALKSHNHRAWIQVIRTLALHVDSEEKRQHVMALVRQVLSEHPNNTDALAEGIILWAAPSANPPRSELMDWSLRYVELEPRNHNALSMRAKMLLQLDGAPAAITFLEDRLKVESVDSELAVRLRDLLARIKAGEDVLSQWP